MEPFEIMVPLASPSLNTLSSSHWRERHRLRLEWYTRIRVGLPMRFKKALEGEKRRVTFTRYGLQLLDNDNFIGGTKLITDCLRHTKPARTLLAKAWVGFGVIWDDDAAHLETVHLQHQVHTRAEIRTVIWVQGVEEAS